ncbi:MAG: hypothetical protein R6V83_11545 [Candidatus Thorarchaeota archaeon]
MTGCIICGRDLSEESNLCEYHQIAKENLERVYNSWKQGLDISYDSYLQKVLEIDLTGRWVKDVADAILAGDVVSTPS